MKNIIRLSLLLAFGLLSASGTSIAQGILFYPSNATVSDDIGFNSAYVGYANSTDWSNKTNGTSPTVNFLSTSTIEQDLFVYNGSTVTISGNAGLIHAFDNSIVNASGNVEFSEGVEASESSTVNISNGFYTDGGVDTSQDFSGTINVNGGTMKFLGAGYSGAGVVATGTVNVRGGTIYQELQASDSCVVNVSGGSLASLVADGGTVNINGGQVTASDYYDAGTINFFGTNLTAVLTNTIGSYEYYSLSGTLLDGTNVTGKLIEIPLNGMLPEGQFTLNNAAVPEANSLMIVLLGSGIGAIRLYRSRRRFAQPSDATDPSV